MSPRDLVLQQCSGPGAALRTQNRVPCTSSALIAVDEPATAQHRYCTHAVIGKQFALDNVGGL
jgi:hypothetical protein